MINKLLQRQIQKHFGRAEDIPEKFWPLLKVICESYDHYEKDRKMLEHSIDLSSNEMIELNGKLRMETNAAKKAHDELNRIFNSIDEVIFSVDITNNKLTNISAACEKIYGYTPEEFYSIDSLWQDVIYPDDKHISYEHMEVLDRGELVSNQYRIIHKNKSIRWIENKIIPTLDENGKLVRLDGVTSDITARKQSERETLSFVDSLQSKNKDLRQFAYIVSHNLRAPIAKIQGLASLFDTGPEDPELNKTLLSNIKTEAVNLDEVVKDINTIISARDSKSAAKERINFENELKLITHVLENEIRESKAVITTDLCTPSEIFTIKSYFYSIMYNLISNAIKYRSHEAQLNIHVQTHQDDKFVCLLIKDNGTGIDLEKNGEKIFGLYKRFHKGNIPGKGIGLNLVKTQAEALGGRVEVESKINYGSTFKIFLPKL
jgi:PAS domain S-box-containing protein